MGFSTVTHHVEYGVTVIQQNVKVGQQARNATPKCGLPNGGSPAHNGDTN
jgi:hypothetical protein